MEEILLKICRVEDLNSAKMLVWQNVDLLGMHIITEKDLWKIEKFKAIVNNLQKNQFFFGSVLVTKIITDSILEKILVKCKFDYLQMHITLNENEIKNIRSITKKLKIKLILVYDPQYDASIDLLTKDNLLIVDNITGGTGHEVDEILIANSIKNKRFILAGGINSSNILYKLIKLSPSGFDIQSFAENLDKSKNFKNVSILTSLLKKGTYNFNIGAKVKVISISLTDLVFGEFENKISPIYNLIDCFHVDHASGWVSKKFVRNSLSIVRDLDILAPSKPYDLHLFLQPEKVLTTIDEYLNLNQRMHIAYIHVEDTIIFNEEVLLNLVKELMKKRIKLGIALQVGEIKIPQLSKFLLILYRLKISEISIVGLSNRASINKYKSLMEPFASEIHRINIKLKGFFNIALDRETTPEKLEIIVKYGISKVFSGKSILNSPNPKNIINQYYELLHGYQL